METMKTKMIEANLGLVAGVRAIITQVRLVGRLEGGRVEPGCV